MTDKDKLIAELKAEIETLKKVKDFACINLNNYIADNNKLKAENERLKEELSGKRFICPQCMEFAKEIHKYKQTLQEIKKIADVRCNECKYGKDGISCKYGDCGEAKLHLITQIITKAESEG